MLETIKSSTEISYLFTQAQRLNTSSITVLVYKSSSQHGHPGRVAFIAGKKNGNAVWRNRAKRRMRALAQSCQAPWSGYDVIFLAKKQTTRESFLVLQRKTKKLLLQAGVIEE